MRVLDESGSTRVLLTRGLVWMKLKNTLEKRKKKGLWAKYTMDLHHDDSAHATVDQML